MRADFAPAPAERTPADTPPVLVGVPATAWLWTRAAQSFLALQRHLPPGSGFTFNFENSSSIAASRNALVELLLSQPQWQGILFVDSDIEVPPDVAQRLLSAGAEMVAAVCFDRRPPYPFVGQTLAAASGRSNALEIGGPQRLVELVCTGMACMYVARTVFERMPYPWFEHPVPGQGEDTLFCAKARRLGHRIWLDTRTVARHCTVMPIDAEVAVAYQQSPTGSRQMQQYLADRRGGYGTPRESAALEKGFSVALERLASGGAGPRRDGADALDGPTEQRVQGPSL